MRHIAAPGLARCDGPGVSKRTGGDDFTRGEQRRGRLAREHLDKMRKGQRRTADTCAPMPSSITSLPRRNVGVNVGNAAAMAARFVGDRNRRARPAHRADQMQRVSAANLNRKMTLHDFETGRHPFDTMQDRISIVDHQHRRAQFEYDFGPIRGCTARSGDALPSDARWSRVSRQRHLGR